MANDEQSTERASEGGLPEVSNCFRLMFENNPLPMWVYDRETLAFLAVNEAAIDHYGYSREHFMAMTIKDIRPTSDVPRLEQYTGRSGPNLFKAGYWRHHKIDGTVIDVEVITHDLRFNQRPARLVLVYDITERKRAGEALRRAHLDLESKIIERTAILEAEIRERKRAEAELRQARDAAESANRAKTRFLANMSHEFRTPLNAILGFTRLTLGDSNLTPGQKENLSMVQRAGEHLLKLINDVLEMSKVEAGRTELQESVFDLHELLHSLEGMIRLRTEGKGLTLRFEIEDDVPVYIKTDERKLYQVMINLLGNGVKFTRTGGITLTAKCLGLNQEKLWLQFLVRDTGIGLSQQDADRLFRPFVQVMTDIGEQEGTGLGLAISKQFVELMGGEIGVQSELGQGSTFHFSIQSKTARRDELDHGPINRRVIGIEPGQNAFRLLIVEDKAENRLLLRRMLESVGFEVREAENGQAGIEMFKQWSPHLIWMDMRMPVMGGYEATRLIKATDRGQATVIVALTASAFEEQRSQTFEAGCDHFVRKPFQEHEIFDVLTRHLGLRFIYEETELEQETNIKLKSGLGVEDLTVLSAKDLADLRLAAASADAERMAELIHRIEAVLPMIASSLRQMADDFRFDHILSLTGYEKADDPH